MENEIKKFDDLEFRPHGISILEIFKDCKMAHMEFENGYGVSVIFGNAFYSNGIDSYELAVLKDGQICYDTEITNNVIGGIKKEEITEIMKKIQML